MIKLFEYKIHIDTRETVPFCGKVFSKLFASFILIAIAAVCASCQPEEMESEQIEGRPAVVRLTVTGEEQANATTRTVNEDVINDLHILIYDSNGELIGQQYTTNNIVTVNTHSAENCTIYAIANTGEQNLFNNYNIHSEATLKKLTYSISTWNELTNKTYLLMTGSIGNVNIAAGEQVISEMKVSRIAAKITLNIKAATNSNITITDYTVYSLPLKSYYILRPLSTESSEIDTNTAHADDAANATNATHWADCPKTTLSAVTSTTITIYMLENRRGVVSSITNQKDKSSTKAPAHATYIEINGLVGGTVKANWKIYLGGNNSNNFNIKRNCSYIYNITLSELVTADTRVELDFTDVQDLSRTGTANCYLAAKCHYWYKFNATVRGNGAATPAIISPTGAELAANALINPTSAELVWETGGEKQIIKSLFLQDGYVYFKTGSTIQGNAVIAVKANNKIIWSWHIWKTSFDLAGLSSAHAQTYKARLREGMDANYWNDFTIASRELKMMDRDLGAASNTPSNTDEVTKTFGLYYQFGRKDPFPTARNRERRADNNSEIVDVFDKDEKKLTAADLMRDYQVKNSTASKDVKGIITYAINNPLTFILHDDNDKSANGGNGTPSYNWIYGAHPACFTTTNSPTSSWLASNSLWGSQFTDNKTSLRLDTKFTGKTIYDPCPAGWCVPPQDTWTNFTTTNTGNTKDYNTSDVAYYNCRVADKANYADGDGSGFMLVPVASGVFGRRYYVSGVDTGAEAFYPAAGYRYGGNGKVCNVGYGCYAWSSAPLQANSLFGSFLSTHIGWVNPVSGTYRSGAFPVRCVQESSVKY